MAREVATLIPWFGSDRMNTAEQVGLELEGCRWALVPFAGGMSALKFITARSLLVSDLHRHVINLARCLSEPFTRSQLLKGLQDLPFHPEILEEAQQTCDQFTPDGYNPNLHAAICYFVTQWMGRSGNGGTEREYKGNLSCRWNANGGDSNTRYRSALKAMVDFSRVMRRCNFEVMDALQLLNEARVSSDTKDSGIYVDAPWPEDGNLYRHKFDDQQQAILADILGGFKKARVVVRFGVHPLIEKLYPKDQWTWRMLTSRTQGNNAKQEALIMNGASRCGGLF
jgi:site-specific DNA-adenine methylase